MTFLGTEACGNTKMISVNVKTSCCYSHAALLHLTCSDHNSLDQFTSVEAGLDDLGATEQGVSLVLLRAEACRRLLAGTGETGLGDWYALS